MPKFFLSPDALHGDHIFLTGPQFSHAKVLRLRPGDSVVVCDGEGTDCRCTVSQLEEDRMELTVQAREAARSEPGVFVSVYAAHAKGDKLEHVVMKATELGAGELVVFPSARCVSRPDEKALRKKLERFQKIAAAAAEQSGRGRIPQVIALPSYEAALSRAAQAGLAVLFYENEKRQTFHSAIVRAPFQTAALITGPEGGFTPEEAAAAAQAGLQVCTLGRRILRCETAPLCALSALLYAVGEF